MTVRPAAASEMRVRVASVTHAGHQRTSNEDAAGCATDEDSAVIVVADGMGGFASGHIAAMETVDAVLATFRSRERFVVHLLARAWWEREHGGAGGAWDGLRENERAELEERVRRLRDGSGRGETLGDVAVLERMRDAVLWLPQHAFNLANARIIERWRSDPRCQGIGSTGVAVIVVGRRALVAHCGDSRAYRLRDRHLEQLTEDHSLINEYRKTRALTPEEIAVFPHNNVIVRALGMKPIAEIDQRRVDVEPGDVVLVATDGLYAELGDRRISTILQRQRGSPEAACAALIEAALEGPATDNLAAAVAVCHAP